MNDSGEAMWYQWLFWRILIHQTGLCYYSSIWSEVGSQKRPRRFEELRDSDSTASSPSLWLFLLHVNQIQSPGKKIKPWFYYWNPGDWLIIPKDWGKWQITGKLDVLLLHASVNCVQTNNRVLDEIKMWFQSWAGYDSVDKTLEGFWEKFYNDLIWYPHKIKAY